ncbi:hypothetical protein WH47_00082 [Habropoda laboriosa]|uniref:Uncharacterized protein n=1 Tax=Habropoda laboriosa TaxID=597456 RepID=A0A0L7RKC5_9HYME|nr:hypothetical protein WH47_00082 [Habropoda laboriosa]
MPWCCREVGCRDDGDDYTPTTKGLYGDVRGERQFTKRRRRSASVHETIVDEKLAPSGRDEERESRTREIDRDTHVHARARTTGVCTCTWPVFMCVNVCLCVRRAQRAGTRENEEERERKKGNRDTSDHGGDSPAHALLPQKLAHYEHEKKKKNDGCVNEEHFSRSDRDVNEKCLGREREYRVNVEWPHEDFDGGDRMRFENSERVKETTKKERSSERMRRQSKHVLAAGTRKLTEIRADKYLKPLSGPYEEFLYPAKVN